MTDDHGLTVADLLTIESLEIRLLAGARGTGRRLAWAHSCELPDPTVWLSADELLMTVGMTFPTAPDEQAALVRKMADAGLAGMLAGDQDPMPALSGTMLEAADALDFPIMLIRGELPFAAVSQHVASLAAVTSTEQVLLLAKLYSITSAREHTRTSVLTRIAELLGVGIRVIEADTGLVLVDTEKAPGAEVPAPESRTAECRTSHDSDSSEHRLRRIRRYQIGTERPAGLEIREGTHRQVSSMVLVHLRNIIEVEVDRLLHRVSDRLVENARTLGQCISEGTSAELAAHLPSADRGLRLVAFSLEAADAFARTAVVNGWPILVTTLRDHGIALIPESHLGAVRTTLASLGARAGVSTEHSSFAGIREAVVQAEDALATSLDHGLAWSEYAGVELILLSRSVTEAERIVDDVLGPIGGDDRRSLVLRETLFVYLANNRRWTESADELGVHRQTLAYRLRQIESLLDRTTTDTDDIAILWIAMRAWSVLHPQI